LFKSMWCSRCAIVSMLSAMLYLLVSVE
jgi:hypothetical protein